MDCVVAYVFAFYLLKLIGAGLLLSAGTLLFACAAKFVTAPMQSPRSSGFAIAMTAKSSPAAPLQP